MMRRRAMGCRAAASSFARLSGGRLTQSLSRRPPRHSLRRSGPPRRRSMSGGGTGTSETFPMMCLMPAYIGTCTGHDMVGGVGATKSRTSPDPSAASIVANLEHSP
jgi:hypothetical protein